jgi:hypothetical protein
MGVGEEWGGRPRVVMPPGKMHVGEVATDASLVRRLLAVQFPQWADLPIAPVPSAVLMVKTATACHRALSRPLSILPLLSSRPIICYSIGILTYLSWANRRERTTVG